MQITCFYQSLDTEFSRDSCKLIELWEKSWSDNGWDPIVLSLDDSKKHPFYDQLDLKDYSSNLYKYSINGYEYLELCYSRWFAYGLFDGAWSDYDVMNYGFSPDDMVKLTNKDPVFIDNIGSCGFSTIKGHNKIIDGLISAYKQDSIVDEILSLQAKNNQPKDISDMHINRRTKSPIEFPKKAVCCENFSSNEWKQFKLVHYHNGLWDHFDQNKYQTRSNFIQIEKPVKL